MLASSSAEGRRAARHNHLTLSILAGKEICRKFFPRSLHRAAHRHSRRFTCQRRATSRAASHPKKTLSPCETTENAPTQQRNTCLRGERPAPPRNPTCQRRATSRAASHPKKTLSPCETTENAPTQQRNTCLRGERPAPPRNPTCQRRATSRAASHPQKTPSPCETTENAST